MEDPTSHNPPPLTDADELVPEEAEPFEQLEFGWLLEPSADSQEKKEGEEEAA